MPGDEERSLPRRVLGEPTVHFFMIAALLFLAAGVLADGEDVIELNQRDISWRISQVEASRDSALTAEEREEVARAYVDEKILVREARRLGLDNDARIEAILSQKMQHVLSDIMPPTEAQLRTFYRGNRTRYARPETVTLDEVSVTPPSKKRPRGLVDGLDRLGVERPDGFRHSVLRRMTLEDLSWAFGPDVGSAAFTGELGRWMGPYTTIRSEHWFRVTERHPSMPLPIDSVRGMVRADWLAEQEQSLLRQRLAELRQRYTVRVIGEEPES